MWIRGHPALAGQRVGQREPAFCNSGHPHRYSPPRRRARCALRPPHRSAPFPFTASPHRRTASTTGRCESPLSAAPTAPLPSPPSLPAPPEHRCPDRPSAGPNRGRGLGGAPARPRRGRRHRRQSKTRRELSPCRAADRGSPAEGLVPEPGGGPKRAVMPAGAPLRPGSPHPTQPT